MVVNRRSASMIANPQQNSAMIQISGNIESGAIVVADATDPGDVKLRLKPDVNPAFRQWFHFRLLARAGQQIRVTILDVGEYNQMKVREGLIGHPVLWENYAAYASYDRVTWFTLPTAFDGKDLVLDIAMAHDALYIATYPPYSLHRHRDVLARWSTDSRVRSTIITVTPDGNDLDLLRVGEPGPGLKAAWITARQHPSETQGPWCVEALVDRLLDRGDPVSRALLERAVFYVVPNLNPDGTARGHTRTNSRGVNLNREWHKATAETSPEIFHTLRLMEEVGVDFMLDIHAWGGDKPFVIGPWNIPTERAPQIRRWRAYMQALGQKTPAFELGQMYPGGGPAPGQADLGMSWNYVGERFGATAILYELVYKKNLAERATESWSIADCQAFGRDSLDAILAALDAE